MQRKLILSIILILITLVIGILIYPQKENKILNSNEISLNNMLSIMVEREAGTGNYNDASSFPRAGYYLNKNLSKCVNGSKLSFSDGNIIIKGNKTDRCYAYFDKDELGSICRGQSLSECFVKNYKKDSTIIYHDGKADYEGMENFELEAGDFSYRYTGGNDVVHNYVCLDSKNTGACESDNDLYQILGLFKNEEDKYEAKLVKYRSATTDLLGDTGAYKNSSYAENVRYHWNSKIDTIDNNATNNWRDSNLNKENLNTIYYNYMQNKVSNFSELVANHIWFLGTNVPYSVNQNSNAKEIYEYELGSNKLTLDSNGCVSSEGIARKCLNEDLYYPYSGMPENINTKIGLIYLSDYGYAAYPKAWSEKFHPLGEGYTKDEIKQNNWMFKQNVWEWTLSRRPDSIGDVNAVRGDGQISSGVVYADVGYVRPTFYLNYNVKIIYGNGTKEIPYRITFE